MLRSRPTSLRSSFNTGKVRHMRSPGLYCTHLVLMEVESEKCGGYLGLFTRRKISEKPPGKRVMTFFFLFLEITPDYGFRKKRSPYLSLQTAQLCRLKSSPLRKKGLQLNLSVPFFMNCCSLLSLSLTLKLEVRLEHLKGPDSDCGPPVE